MNNQIRFEFSDWDRTMFWCSECGDYQKFAIYDKTKFPAVCQVCKNGFRKMAMAINATKHPPICRV